MASVAFIGPDGTGKTTLTRRLEQSGLLRFRYLYMGVNIHAADHVLPTARAAAALKQWLHPAPPASAAAHAAPARTGTTRVPRWLWAGARLANHVADEWYRQLVSWAYQLRGYVVLYDRHFVFDFSPEIVEGRASAPDRWLHHWLVTHVYPRPDLVFFLDAPPEVLFARKAETSIEELERRRRSFARLGRRIPNFVRVDATQPPDAVLAEVTAHILRFYGKPVPAATSAATPLATALVTPTALADAGQSEQQAS